MDGGLLSGRTMMRWLGSVWSVFGAVGRGHGTGAASGLTSRAETGGIMGRRVAGSPGRRVAGSPGRRVAGSPGRRVAGSPGRRVAGSPGRRVAGSPGRRVALRASSWWRRLRRSASRPESSASAGWRSDTRRPASSSDSFDPSPARAAAGSRAAVRNPRRGLLPALLCLPLLFGLAAPAAAQTTPSISPSTLIEHGVTNGEGTLVTIRNIPSSWVAPVNHSLTTTGTGTGHAILANAGNCGIADAFGNSLDTYDVCDAQASGYDADSNLYQIGLRASLDSHSDSGETFTVTLTDSSTPPNTVSFTMTINDPPPEISASLPDQEGVSRVDGKQPHEENVGSVVFDLSADKPLANDLTVCVRVSESGGNRVASGNEDIQTATLLASGTSNGSGSYTVTWTDTAADDPDSTVIVQVVPPETVGCSATDGSYAVSTDDASDTVLITDDEDTTVSLTASSDTTMTEGDATDTAVLTISLDRRLYGGETIGVPIALASTTGARLPGSTDSGTANHDFTVAAAAASMHTGVTLANADCRPTRGWSSPATTPTRCRRRR